MANKCNYIIHPDNEINMLFNQSVEFTPTALLAIWVVFVVILTIMTSWSYHSSTIMSFWKNSKTAINVNSYLHLLHYSIYGISARNPGSIHN